MNKIINYLKDKGIKIIITTPEKHDKEIARSLALVHYIGRALENIKAKQQIIDSEGYKRLLHILETVSNDTPELFKDMHHYNRYAKQERKQFLKALNTINKKLT